MLPSVPVEALREIRPSPRAAAVGFTGASSASLRAILAAFLVAGDSRSFSGPRALSIPRSLGIMFAKGRVVRISIEPHHYDPRGHSLRFTPSSNVEQGYGTVFETDGEKVTSYRSGILAAIALVEGAVDARLFEAFRR